MGSLSDVIASILETEYEHELVVGISISIVGMMLIREIGVECHL